MATIRGVLHGSILGVLILLVMCCIKLYYPFWWAACFLHPSNALLMYSACNCVLNIQRAWNHVSSRPDSFCNLDIPIINVELDGIFDLPHIAPFRNSVALVKSAGSVESDDDCESTVLWRHWDPPQHTRNSATAVVPRSGCYCHLYPFQNGETCKDTKTRRRTRLKISQHSQEVLATMLSGDTLVRKHLLFSLIFFLFALFDSLAILPLTSHVRLETGCWEGRACFPAAAAASHLWISRRKTVLHICPADALPPSPALHPPPSFLRGLKSTSPQHSCPMWAFTVSVPVCVFPCLVIVLYDVALLVLWSLNRNACFRRLGKLLPGLQRP